jgi:hypothetical protein
MTGTENVASRTTKPCCWRSRRSLWLYGTHMVNRAASASLDSTFDRDLGAMS